MPTLRLSGTSPLAKSWTQTMKVCETNHVGSFHDFCLQQSLNSIRATQTGLLRTCHGLCRKLSRWFVFATFMFCVGDTFTETL